MNIIELVMVEHASLRLHFRFVREKSAEPIFEVEDFVRNCHARVEDEIVFPSLEQMVGTESQQLTKIISRLEADHRLIEKIGEQIKIHTAQDESEALRKKILLYADTVESHNSSEETLIFQFWKADSEKERESIDKARKIIEEFGRERYFRVTVISERLFDMAA
ncbi:MAG: hemerythrin domain-containing protein [Nitrososphaerota archaeon]|nr:hemerythrin domain-containing protein [Nitrososphaerota archaeon]